MTCRNTSGNPSAKGSAKGSRKTSATPFAFRLSPFALFLPPSAYPLAPASSHPAFGVVRENFMRIPMRYVPRGKASRCA